MRVDDQLVMALLDVSDKLSFCCRAAERNGDTELIEAVRTCAWSVTAAVAMCARATIRVDGDIS